MTTKKKLKKLKIKIKKKIQLKALPKFLGKARFGPPLSYAVGPVPRRGVVFPKIAVKVWEMSVS